MTRIYLFALVVAILAGAGCVPVTEPPGDVEKAEPDKELIGTWSRGAETFRVGVPEVKGNPKGLMYADAGEKGPSNTSPASVIGSPWFYTHTIGKSKYMVVISNGVGGTPKFGAEGTFAEWKKQKGHRYYIARYVREGDELTLDIGETDVWANLMAAEKIEATGQNFTEFYHPPAGWLNKYLKDTGPDKVFDGTGVFKYTREEKK